MNKDNSFSEFSEETIQGISSQFTEVSLLKETESHQLYRAKRYGRWYLLKAISPALRNSEFHQQMLHKEMEVLMQLQHPGIVDCLGMEHLEDYTDSEGKLISVGSCIVLEYIDGQTLAELLNDKSGSNDNSSFFVLHSSFLDELLDALAYMHSSGITHRDLKPSNIMLTHNGQHVKIIDFSLADTNSHAILKQPSGTCRYISPEQATATTPDVRNDIYSLGVIMQKLPLQGFWHKITKRCLLPIDKRYANVQELQADIDRYKRRAVRRRWMIPLAALVLVLLAGAASIYKLDADRRAMYQQLNRIPIATEKGLRLLEEQISATGLTLHTDTLTAWRYLDSKINEKILAVNDFAYDYVEEQLTDFNDKEREEILIVMLDRWQVWHDTITTRAKHIISLDTLYNIIIRNRQSPHS